MFALVNGKPMRITRVTQVDECMGTRWYQGWVRDGHADVMATATGFLIDPKAAAWTLTDIRVERAKSKRADNLPCDHVRGAVRAGRYQCIDHVQGHASGQHFGWLAVDEWEWDCDICRKGDRLPLKKAKAWLKRQMKG